MDREKYFIWSNIDLDFKDCASDLREQYPEMTDNQLEDIMFENNDDSLTFERENLDIQLAQSIIVIAELGLWHGKKPGYKMIDSGNIKDCLYSNNDYVEWYVDKSGEFRCTDHHHDGMNYYLYRGVKSEASDEQVYDLQALIYNGKVTQKDIDRVTYRLGDEIGKVYGWEFPKQQIAGQKKSQNRHAELSR